MSNTKHLRYGKKVEARNHMECAELSGISLSDDGAYCERHAVKLCLGCGRTLYNEIEIWCYRCRCKKSPEFYHDLYFRQDDE